MIVVKVKEPQKKFAIATADLIGTPVMDGYQFLILSELENVTLAAVKAVSLKNVHNVTAQATFELNMYQTAGKNMTGTVIAAGVAAKQEMFEITMRSTEVNKGSIKGNKELNGQHNKFTSYCPNCHAHDGKPHANGCMSSFVRISSTARIPKKNASKQQWQLFNKKFVENTTRLDPQWLKNQ